LNSAPFEYGVISHTQTGGKSFAQPGILKTLRLPKFEDANPLHQELANLSRQAHQGNVDDDAIAHYAAELWGLEQRELQDVLDSLNDWR
jgi:hypothetical protein